jgi:hypothetical protein
LIDLKISGMIAIPVSLASDFIHIAGKSIHIAPEYTIHITGIRTHRPTPAAPHLVVAVA